MSKELISRDILDDIWELYEKYHPYLATRVLEFGDALKDLIDNAPTVEERSESEWIPIITRDMDNEELEEFAKNTDFSVEELDPWCYACQLPDDGQEVIISTSSWGVTITEFYADEYGCYFEGYEDKGDVIAWRPLPKPYKKGGREDE
jgi:hypothetical protein